MPKKTPGKLQSPPATEEFSKLPLANWCKSANGIFYRLHSTNQGTGAPWPPVFFSQQGRSRFDPTQGPGTFYIAESLAGALLEIFDDHWGPVGSSNRMITRSELDTWWVTLIALPETTVFETAGASLSKIGTDLQLLSGDHAVAREWAVRVAEHPVEAGGIAYVSRHDHTKRNLAIFRRAHLFSEISDKRLIPAVFAKW